MLRSHPNYWNSWWRHQMETFSVLLALCVGNSPVIGEFPSQRPVARSFDVFFDPRLKKRLNKQSKRRWFETPSRSVWRHCIVQFGRHWLGPRDLNLKKKVLYSSVSWVTIVLSDNGVWLVLYQAITRTADGYLWPIMKFLSKYDTFQGNEVENCCIKIISSEVWVRWFV